MGINQSQTVSILPSLDAQSHISFAIKFEPYLREHFPECCLPDGIYACPECGGALEIDKLHGKCVGSCPDKTRVKNVWTLHTIKQGWESKGGGKRAINHLAARLGVAVAWERAKRTKDRQRELLTAALSYAARGWQLFPVWSIGKDGKCACGGQRDCKPGKHPATRNGLNDAATDRTQILEWWSRWPEANIGVAAGAASGFFVLDVDGDAGQISLSGLEEQHGKLPGTVESITGSGGRHILFKYPHDRKIRNSTGSVGQGLDVRGDGGFIVAPPSNHYSGGSYVWEVSSQPDDVEVAEAPEWLLGLMEDTARTSHHRGTSSNESRQHGNGRFVLPEQIDEGARNDVLLRYSRSLKAKKLSDDDIRLLVRAANDSRCKPPLPQSELDTVIHQGLTLPDREMASRGRERASEPKVCLYHEQDFLDSYSAVWLVPDQQSADVMRAWNSPHTSVTTILPGGLSAWRDLAPRDRKGNPQIPVSLTDRCIRILIGTTDDHRRLAEEIAGDLYPGMRTKIELGRSLKIIELPGLDNSTGLADLIEQHGEEAVKARLNELVKTTGPYVPPLRTKAGIALAGETFFDLSQKEFSAQKWIAANILPVGLTILAGKPKVGKSWMAQQLSLCVATGKPLFDAYPCAQGDVLHISLEDSDRRFKERMVMQLQGTTAPRNAVFHRKWPILPEAYTVLEEQFKRNPNIRLIIIDTLGRIRGPAQQRENDYDKATRELGPFQALAGDLNIGIVMIHHRTKRQDKDHGDSFDSLHGSVNIQGVADAAWILDKTNRLESKGTLAISGRDNLDMHISIDFDPETGRWSYLGDAVECKLTEERQAIRNILRSEGKPLSTQNILDLYPEPRPKKNSLQKTLGRMVDNGLLEKAAGQQGKYILLPEGYQPECIGSAAAAQGGVSGMDLQCAHESSPEGHGDDGWSFPEETYYEKFDHENSNHADDGIRLDAL